MKRILWHITLASMVTLVAYIALYAIWGALLGGLEDTALHLFLVASMTTVAFGYFLLYISKIRNSTGEDEVISDYANKKYVSLLDDLKRIIHREAKILACIGVIVLLCFALNTFDGLIFEKKTISFPTFFFIPLYFLSSWINMPFVGYVLNAVADCAIYILFLLVYRRRKYKYWLKNKA